MHKKYGWMESDHATHSLVVFQSQEESSGEIYSNETAHTSLDKFLQLLLLFKLTLD